MHSVNAENSKKEEDPWRTEWRLSQGNSDIDAEIVEMFAIGQSTRSHYAVAVQSINHKKSLIDALRKVDVPLLATMVT